MIAFGAIVLAIACGLTAYSWLWAAGRADQRALEAEAMQRAAKYSDPLESVANFTYNDAPDIPQPSAWVHREGHLPVPLNPLGRSAANRVQS